MAAAFMCLFFFFMRFCPSIGLSSWLLCVCLSAVVSFVLASGEGLSVGYGPGVCLSDGQTEAE